MRNSSSKPNSPSERPSKPSRSATPTTAHADSGDTTKVRTQRDDRNQIDRIHRSLHRLNSVRLRIDRDRCEDSEAANPQVAKAVHPALSREDGAVVVPVAWLNREDLGKVEEALNYLQATLLAATLPCTFPGCTCDGDDLSSRRALRRSLVPWSVYYARLDRR